MKILLFAINSLNEDIFLKKLNQMGYEAELYRTKCEDYMFDGNVAREMITLINDKKFEAVVSFDYIPIVSMVCDVCKLPYYSWGYDSPQLTLYAKTVVYPNNKISVFDREQADFLRNIGLDKIHHIPMAVDPDEFARRIEDNTKKIDRFSDRGYSDISFVGSLYTDARKCNLYDTFRQEAVSENKDLKVWQEMDEYISKRLFKRNPDFIYEDVSDITNFLKPYMAAHSMGLGDNYFEVEDIITREEIIEKKLSADERILLMNSIAQFSQTEAKTFALYTSSDTKNMQYLNPCNRGIVDYGTEMPIVFNRSRININITIRSIHSGIPLRALDIMGCGGFLLTNAQEEIVENFDDGVHLATFETPEECIDKIKYYLSHEDERKKISVNGLERVRAAFSYESAIERLLSI